MSQVWDLRKIKETLKVFEDLPNHYGQTNIAFSPDEQLFLTGTSVERESTSGGLLCFYDRANLELVSRVGISPTFSVVQCAWHPKLNQVTLSWVSFVGHFWSSYLHINRIVWFVMLTIIIFLQPLYL